MSEISLIELIVYGIVGYTGLILLISSSFRDMPSTKSQSAVRSIWTLAPLFCMYMLAQAGEKISMSMIETLNYNVTSNLLVSNSTIVESYTLVQPVWVTLHFLFFTMLLLFFIWNMLQLLIKRN